MNDNGSGTALSFRDTLTRLANDVSWIKATVNEIKTSVAGHSEEISTLTGANESTKARLDSHRTTLRGLLGGFVTLAVAVLLWVLTHGWVK